MVFRHSEAPKVWSRQSSRWVKGRIDVTYVLTQLLLLLFEVELLVLRAMLLDCSSTLADVVNCLAVRIEW